MSIASQLQAYENGLTDSYNMVSQKGGTMPVHKNMSSLASSIATIPSGGGSFVGIPREVNSQGLYTFPSQTFSFSLPANATDISARILNSAFYRCSSLTSVDLSHLTSASGDYAAQDAFYECTALTSVDLSSLVTANGSHVFTTAFRGCTSLASVNLSSLTTVGGANAFSSSFYGCTSLASIDLSSVETVSGSNAFASVFTGCSSLASVNLSSLTSITGASAFNNTFNTCTSLTSFVFDSLSVLKGASALSYAFRDCYRLTSVSFPSLTTTSFGTSTNQFNNMLYSCSGVTVHFPAAIQSTIGSWASVTGGFGGTNITVLYDL